MARMHRWDGLLRAHRPGIVRLRLPRPTRHCRGAPGGRWMVLPDLQAFDVEGYEVEVLQRARAVAPRALGAVESRRNVPKTYVLKT